MSSTLQRSLTVRVPGRDDSDAVIELARLIVAGADDTRLRWTPGRDACRVATTLAAPEELRRSCEERLRRFNEGLRLQMAGSGWVVSGGWWRRPKPAAAPPTEV